jgi:hypothetical protein
VTRGTVLLLVAMAWLAIAIAVVVHYELRSVGHAIDCGPDGISALNGTACIDREPVVLP